MKLTGDKCAWLIIALLAACSPQVNIPSPSQTSAPPTILPAASASSGSFPTLLPTTFVTPTAHPPGWWTEPYLPEPLRQFLPDGWLAAISRPAASAYLEIGSQGKIIGHWTFVLVAPFATLLDGISEAMLRQTWSGKSGDSFSNQPLLVSPETLAILSAWWGAPADGAVQILPASELLDYARQQRPESGCACAILPFEALEPRWKVLTIDGISPLMKEFNSLAYALNAPISLVSVGQTLSAKDSARLAAISNNRDPQKLTEVILTGTTALVRATAWMMETKGITYPAEDIGRILSSADITHISNEVSFNAACPPANPNQQTQIIFCSPPAFIQLLEDIGARVIELDGDHLLDQGAQPFLDTLQLYKDHGLAVYGGGANAEEAARPVLFDDHGNKIAFLGCNAKAVGTVTTATAESPGPLHCNWLALEEEITSLKSQGYLVIVTLQHTEYWKNTVDPTDRQDFLRMAIAGAVIVHGSQAHMPQNFEFYNNSFIHYGTGNLFFDQLRIVDTANQRVADKSFVDQHFFYNGRYISTALLTLQFVDFARPRLMTPAERSAFLTLIFQASGWK